MSKSFLYVANWKAYLSFSESIAWIDTFGGELDRLVEEGEVVICPDFLALNYASSQVPISIAIGAQDCSAHGKGAFTGDVTATSLKQAGAKYCIVGHSERRRYEFESLESMVQKTLCLLKVGITPLICMSEAVEDELPQFLDKLGAFKDFKKDIVFAYEPESAIGTDTLPSIKNIDTVCAGMKSILAHKWGENTKILYGGSVSDKTIVDLKKITSIDGFLIGRASTDFQALEKIVVLV